MRIVAGALALSTLAVLVVGSASARPRPSLPLVPASLARLVPVLSTGDLHKLDLTQLVPRAGQINHVWYIPAGSGHAQIAVAWQQGNLRGWTRHGYDDTRRYYLALWNPQPPRTDREKRWVPHLLVAASPFPIADYFGDSAIRLADVTGDGHDDLLVTIGCNDCNHGTSSIFVVATFGRHVRRIYGGPEFLTKKDPKVGVRGTVIIETYWGARNGQLWFNYPYKDYFSATRRLVFRKWQQGGGWRTVSRRLLTFEQIERMGLLPRTR